MSELVRERPILVLDSQAAAPPPRTEICSSSVGRCAATQVRSDVHSHWKGNAIWPDYSRRCRFRGPSDVLLPDVNVLIYAHRAESPEHERYAEWLRHLASGMEPFGLSELGASAFVRIVTNAKIWEEPTTLPDALEFIDRLRARPGARPLSHGSGSWDIFAALCRAAKARGKLVADAYHAALAIEHGCELVTTDGDFARFAGLRCRHPLRG